jgi:G3E family GTPase
VHTERCKIALDKILGLGSFDLNEILKHEPDFLIGEKAHDHHGKDHHDHDHETCTDPTHDHGHHHHHDHVHDSAISSISLTTEKPIDGAKFEAWMGDLNANKGQDLLRYKGILDIAGSDKRLAIQGVHMMMEASELSPWKAGAKRHSRMVFIGRKLDEKELRDGFNRCVAG